MMICYIFTLATNRYWWGVYKKTIGRIPTRPGWWFKMPVTQSVSAQYADGLGTHGNKNQQFMFERYSLATHFICILWTLYDTITKIITCAQKRTNGQHNLPHDTIRKSVRLKGLTEFQFDQKVVWAWWLVALSSVFFSKGKDKYA